MAVLALIGPDLALGGYLMALLAGWLAAFALIGGVRRIEPQRLSMAVHVALGVAMGLLLYLLTARNGLRATLPSHLKPAFLVLQLGAVPAAGWVWMTFIGRISGAVKADSDRRAAQLKEPEWVKEGDAWCLHTPAVPVRRRTLYGIVAALFVLGTAVFCGFLLFFYDRALRMSPMLMLLVLGWTVGMPVYLLLGVWARRRTVLLTLRVTAQRWRVLRADGGTPLVDAPLASIRRLQWAGRSSPTRVALQTDDGVDIVLLIGMARHDRGAASTLAPLPQELIRLLRGLGVEVASPRSQKEALTVARKQSD